MHVLKNISHINSYCTNVIPGSFFSQFQILSNSLADSEKNLALRFFLSCQSAYLSVSLGHARKKLKSPSVVSRAQWSQHFAVLVREGQ